MTNDLSDIRLTAAAAHREALLRAGQAWEQQGMINSAIDAYTRLLERYRGSTESRTASERLLLLGLMFEEQGHHHEALSLFDKLESLT
jgi:tetratricopeptide (TPR) repeat protein